MITADTLTAITSNSITARAIVAPIVQQVVDKVTPAIVTAITTVIVTGVLTISAVIVNILHRITSNAAVLTAIQAVTPPAQASNPIIGMVKAAPVDAAPTQTADSAHNSV